MSRTDSSFDPFFADRAAADERDGSVEGGQDDLNQETPTEGPENFGDVVDEARAIADAHEPGVEEDEVPSREAGDERISRQEALAYVQQERQRAREIIRQVQRQKSIDQHVVEELGQEFDRIMSLPEADSWEAWVDFNSRYSGVKARAETEFWRNRAIGHEEAAFRQAESEQMREYVPHLQNKLRQFADEATNSVRSHLSGLSPEAQRKFADRIHHILVEEADAGRIYYHQGTLIPGTALPALDVDFGHIASVVAREVETAKAIAWNARAEAQRRSPTPVPPGISARGDFSGGSGRSSGSSAGSFSDLLREVIEE